MEKRNSSINTMSHDAPTVSARFIYGSTTTHDGRATIHHGGATNAHDASTIRYGASTIQAGRATVASRPPTNVHDQLSFLVILSPSLFNNSLDIAGSTLRKFLKAGMSSFRSSAMRHSYCPRRFLR